MYTGSTPFFLGRQPIVGAGGELVAYELLFRSFYEKSAAVLNDIEASAEVIQYAFTDLGVELALGDKLGFINVSQALLLSDVLETLPRQRVVLEIQQSVAFTLEVVARCQDLRRAGYTLALDDVVALTEPQLAVLPLMSVIKIDVPAVHPQALAGLVQQARLHGAQVLAERIDTVEKYEFCRDIGFDLYQGYYFARPVILPGISVQSSSLALLKLVSLVSRDAELPELEDTLKHAPDLTLRLLRLANSAAINRARQIDSVQTAIHMIGRAQLNRMAQIMLFQQQNRANAAADPVTQLAVVRGRLMETAAKSLGWSAAADRAFMVGMLSLVDTLFGRELLEIVEPLNLEESVMQALLHREGELGLLLQLAEASELEEAGRGAALMEALGLRDVDAFNRMQIDALTWASRL
jgi:c-di-GMP-related signal transduction protein